MGKVLIALAALGVGAVAGAVLGTALLGGAMTGAGVAVGLSAGICSTVKAAQEEGLMTPEQVDQVMNRAAADVAAASGKDAPAEIAGSAAACETALARLREAGA
jgi:hypothetical protein